MFFVLFFNVKIGLKKEDFQWGYLHLYICLGTRKHDSENWRISCTQKCFFLFFFLSVLFSLLQWELQGNTELARDTKLRVKHCKVPAKFISISRRLKSQKRIIMLYLCASKWKWMHFERSQKWWCVCIIPDINFPFCLDIYWSGLRFYCTLEEHGLPNPYIGSENSMECYFAVCFIFGANYHKLLVNTYSMLAY